MCAKSHSMAASASALPVARSAFLQRISGKPMAVSCKSSNSLSGGSDGDAYNNDIVLVESLLSDGTCERVAIQYLLWSRPEVQPRQVAVRYRGSRLV